MPDHSQLKIPSLMREEEEEVEGSTTIVALKIDN